MAIGDHLCGVVGPRAECGETAYLAEETMTVGNSCETHVCTVVAGNDADWCGLTSIGLTSAEWTMAVGLRVV